MFLYVFRSDLKRALLRLGRDPTSAVEKSELVSMLIEAEAQAAVRFGKRSENKAYGIVSLARKDSHLFVSAYGVAALSATSRTVTSRATAAVNKPLERLNESKAPNCAKPLPWSRKANARPKMCSSRFLVFVNSVFPCHSTPHHCPNHIIILCDGCNDNYF